MSGLVKRMLLAPLMPKMPETALSEPLEEEVVTVRWTTGAGAASTRLTTEEAPVAEPPLLTTRLVVVVRPVLDVRELDTVLWNMGTGMRLESTLNKKLIP